MQSGIINCCKIMLVCLVIVSCGKSKEDEKLFEELNLCLENSNKIIEHRSQSCLRKLEEDLQDFAKRDRASIWLTKAKQVEILSNEIIINVDSLENKLLSTPSKRIDEKEANILFGNMTRYKQKLLLIDESITTEFRSMIDVNDSIELSFIKSFTNSNSISKLAVYKNKVVRIKEMLIEYCSKMDGVLICGMIDHFSFIATQNSTHFKPNETLEIKAGVGTFSKAANPKISVNNNDVKVNDEGVAEYKTKVSNEKGTYKKLVKIQFAKPDGTISTVEKEMIYTVDE